MDQRFPDSGEHTLSKLTDALMEAEARASGGDPAGLEAAIESATRVMEMLQAPEETNDPQFCRLLAWAAFIRANALRDQHTASSLPAAIASYDQALAALESMPPTDDPNYTNDLANVWTNRGIALLNESSEGSLAASLPCFDQAIALRSRLPLDANPLFRYGLTSGWMNRADALTRLGSPENLAEAVSAYDEALAHLAALPLDANPLFEYRQAIAWMNRGITLQAQGTQESLAQAVQSFDATIGVFEKGLETDSLQARSILACAWMNRSNALLRATPPKLDQASASALKSLTFTAGNEESSLIFAETGLKARHLLCQATSALLGAQPGVSQEELISTTTDAVDEAMQLIRHWELHGINHFRPAAHELFRFGARIYQVYQPHFLGEFVLETLDPEQSKDALADSKELHETAATAVWDAINEIQQTCFRALNTPRYERLMETISSLRIAETRLRELRGQYRPA